MIPIHVACIGCWIRHRRDPESAEVRINSLRAREYLLLGMAGLKSHRAIYVPQVVHFPHAAALIALGRDTAIKSRSVVGAVCVVVVAAGPCRILTGEHG